MMAKENRKIDIELVLKPRKGGGVHESGLVDRNLFTGDNTLHAKMDTQTCLWRLEYDKGSLPKPLKTKFTGWVPLINYVTAYMDKRNVDIVEIRD